MTDEGCEIASPGLKAACCGFALIGALVILYQAIGYVHWMSGPSFAAVAPGPDDIPAQVLAQVRNLERNLTAAAIAWTLFLIGYSAWRRALTWPLVLSIVWAATYWQDSMVNAGGQAFTLNLHFFNRGDWISALPLAPVDRPTMTQPLKMEAPSFYVLNPLFSMLAAGVMTLAWKFLRVRNALALIVIGAGVGVALDSAAELSSIGSGVLAWNQAFPLLSVHAGTTRQWPVYEGLMLGSLWSSLGILYFFRGRNRFSPWDHGLNFIASPGKRDLATLLMLVGVLNTVFMAYNLTVVRLSLMSPHVDGFPSYLRGPTS